MVIGIGLAVLGICALVYGVLAARLVRFIVTSHLERLDRVEAAALAKRIVELEHAVQRLNVERIGRR